MGTRQVSLSVVCAPACHVRNTTMSRKVAWFMHSSGVY